MFSEVCLEHVQVICWRSCLKFVCPFIIIIIIIITLFSNMVDKFNNLNCLKYIGQNN